MDAVEVDAKPIDNELGVISKAEQWLAGASERVAERCELYRPPARIENEKQRKDAVASRAQCRKDAAEIDNERKAILREAEDALKKFKSEVKDVLSPLTDLDVEYKRLLDEYEESWRTTRQIELTKEYEAIAPDLVELVPFERLMAAFGNEKGKVWLNRSTNIQAAKEMIGVAIYQIADAERIIREQVDQQDVHDTLISYFNTLDLQRALTTARGIKEQREQLARLEAQRAEREAQWAEQTPEPQPMATAPTQPMPIMNDVPHSWVIVASSATKAQMLQLRDYARSVGIPFDCIYSGTLEQVWGRVGNAR